MGFKTRRSRYKQLDDRAGPCSTQTWMLRLEWTRGVKAAYDRGGRERTAIDQLLAEHQRRLPSTLHAGDEVVTSLDDQSLFPDTIYVMTACGSNASWRKASAGKTRLFCLIGYPNAF
jgi:hypothetical protein